LERAKQFDIHKILPHYEAFYEQVSFQSKSILA